MRYSDRIKGFRCGVLASLICVVVCIAGSAGRAAASEYSVKEGTLVAKDGDTVVWSIRLAAAKAEPYLFQPPVLSGERLYAIAGTHLYVIDPKAGVVTQRIDLPGACLALTADGAGVAVVAGTKSDNPDINWSATYHVAPDKNDVPFTRPADAMAERLPRQLVQGLLEEELSRAVEKSAPKVHVASKLTAEDRQAAVAAALAGFTEIEKRDPTNVFALVFHAKALAAENRKAEADAVLANVLKMDPAYDYQLIGVVLDLDAQAPALADAAFTRGMKSLLEHGYQPESVAALINLMIYYGSPRDVADMDASDPKNLDRLNQLGERLWDMAPTTEMIHYFYAGLARANAKAGHVDAANLWQKRTEIALQDDGWLCSMDTFERTGHSMTLIGALFLSLMTAFLIRTIRCASAIKTTPVHGWRRWMLFNYWTKAEQFGMLACIGLMLMASYQLARGIRIVGVGAAAPLSAMSGFQGHPQSVAFWKKGQGNPNGDLEYAVALQASGDLEGAAAIYARLPQAQAKNNLGVIRDAQGKADEAKALFEAALAQDPALQVAACNLGRSTDAPEWKRRAKYGITAKLVAQPSPQMRDDATAHFGGQGPALYPALGDLNGSGGGTVASALMYFLVLAAGLLLVVSLCLPHIPAPERLDRPYTSWVGWCLQWVAPGTARQWSVFGTLALTLFFFSFLVNWELSNSSGASTNVLEAMATPNIRMVYGPVPVTEADLMTMPPLTMFVRGTQYWFVWLFLVNLVVIGVGEKLRPDPLGPFGGKTA